MICYEAFLPPISADAQQRIKAGLLEIDAIWHTYPHQADGALQTGKRYLSLSYHVFANEIFSEMDITDELLQSTLVKLAYESVIEHYWVYWIVGTLAPTRCCTEHLFTYWVRAGSLERANLNLLAGPIAAWRAKAIRRALASKQKPAELLDKFRSEVHPNLSHEALADEMGLERSRYFKLKAGKRVRDDAYNQVADFTGIPIGDLRPPIQFRTSRRRSPTNSDEKPTD
jgi:hypothetical protein